MKAILKYDGDLVNLADVSATVCDDSYLTVSYKNGQQSRYNLSFAKGICFYYTLIFADAELLFNEEFIDVETFFEQNARYHLNDAKYERFVKICPNFAGYLWRLPERIAENGMKVSEIFEAIKVLNERYSSRIEELKDPMLSGEIKSKVRESKNELFSEINKYMAMLTQKEAEYFLKLQKKV
jgi:hypothetical protein